MGKHEQNRPNFSVLNVEGYQLQPYEYAQPALLVPERTIFYTPTNATLPNDLGKLVLNQRTPALTDYDQVDFLSERDSVEFSRVFKIQPNVYAVDDSYLNIVNEAYLRDRFTIDLGQRSAFDFSSSDFAPVIGWAGNEAQLKAMLEEIADIYNWNADPDFLQEYEENEGHVNQQKPSDRDY